MYTSRAHVRSDSFTIRCSLLFFKGTSLSQFSRLICLEGKTQTPTSSLLSSLFIFTIPTLGGLVKSSSAKCTEHSEEVFPGTQFFLLSRAKFTHRFHLLCFIGHVLPKKRNSMKTDVVFGIINVVTTSGNAPFWHFKLNGVKSENSEANFPLVFQ